MAKADDKFDRLTTAVDQLSDNMCGLKDVLENVPALAKFTDEIRVLRSAIDDVRAEIEWAIRNLRDVVPPRPYPPPITSLPRDATDPEFAAKLNTAKPSDLPPDDLQPTDHFTATDQTNPDAADDYDDDPPVETSPHPPPTLSVRQFDLDGEQDPSIPYCCVAPELEWIGEHDDAEIICAKCGQIVAVLHDGQMVRGLEHAMDGNGSNCTPEEPGLEKSQLTQNQSTPNDSSDLNDESPGYCCTEPHLTWHGDPDAPGIACANCGFVVAEEGCLEIWRHSTRSAIEYSPPPLSPDPQRNLLFADDDGPP